MAVFRHQRLRPPELVLHFPAVALRAPCCCEVGLVRVDEVRRAVFPLVFFAVRRGVCLVLVLAGVSVVFSVMFT